MTRNAKIPFLELVTPHVELEEQLVSVFRSTLKTAGFVGGPMVEEFEREFAEFCEVQFCVGVASGTDALRFALIAAGVQRGDTVLTVPNTFAATTEAISQAGGWPDFVDIDGHTYNMDPQKLQEYLETQCHVDRATGRLLNENTGRPVTAIVPVHLYGQTANMDSILELARQHRLIVIEDACQAHGAEYFSRKEKRWRKAGSMGRAAAFSFYPGKNLGACGEAGAVTTNDETISERIRMLRDHGQAQKYYHDLEGYNSRLDAIQAGVLRAKLPYLAEWNRKRREVAVGYHQLLQPLAEIIMPPYEPSWCKAVYHLYVIRSKDREGLQGHLAEASIGTGVHYPVALHLQKAYLGMGYKKGDFPIAEKAAAEVLSLPMYPQLRPEQQQRVAKEVFDFFGCNTSVAA